jgi:hypothetical protein
MVAAGSRHTVRSGSAGGAGAPGAVTTWTNESRSRSGGSGGTAIAAIAAPRQRSVGVSPRAPTGGIGIAARVAPPRSR